MGVCVCFTRSKQYCNQPSEDLGDTAVADLQYPGDVAWSRARMRELDDLLPRRVRKRSTADEDTPQLVHPAVSCKRMDISCLSLSLPLIIFLTHFGELLHLRETREIKFEG